MMRKRDSALSLLLTFLFMMGGLWGRTAVTHANPSQTTAATFTVTTTTDSGPGSLRQAITDANANPGLDTITFAIGATGSQQTIQPSALLPSITSPVFLDGWSQGGVGYNGPPLIELNGALAGSYGLRITAGSSTVRGLAINGFVSGVILLTADGNWIYGCHIGTDLAGETAVSNITGISISTNSNSNIIGVNGDGVGDAAEGNLISGNSDWGILFAQIATMHNVVAGNKIGTDITGMSAIRNGFGGSPRGGIYLGGYDNLVGSNFDGVSDDLERNLISGNANNSTSGILMQYVDQPGALPNAIAGNWIGVDATGLAALPNNYGMYSASGAMTGLIVRRNVISANTYDGIRVNMNQATVSDNLIGVAADGTTPLGNGNHGILLTGSDNQIGGTDSGEANIIAHNGTASAFFNGVLVSNTALRNTIRGNRIFANSRLGIDLRWPDGVNANDDDDPDTGGNNLQNYPIITFAQSYANGTTAVQGTLNSNPNTTFTLDFYYSAAADNSGHGEGEFYLGAGSAATDAGGDATFDVTLPATIPPSQFVSATATHADGSTSEFSLALAVGGVIDVPIQGLIAAHTGFGYSNDPVTFAASISAGTGVSYEWDLGDGNLAAGAFVEHSYAAPGVYTATVSASNNSSSAQAQTVVSVVEAANINGRVWNDLDVDGMLGIGEGGLAGVTVTAVGPTGTIEALTDADGRYQLFTPAPGLYTVSASANDRTPTTASPIPIPMGDNGGTVVDFGLHDTPPTGFGIIAGRAWVDLDGSGFPEPDEEALAGRQVDIYGSQFPLQTTTTDSSGLFSLLVPSNRTYLMWVFAPGFFPDERTFGTIWLSANAPLMNLHAPFARGGTVSGQVVKTSGAGVPNTLMHIGMPISATLTNANGSYTFLEQEPSENKVLGMVPPPPYVNYNGDGFRVFSLPPNSFVSENWLVERIGRLTVHTTQNIGSQSLPVGNIFFRVQGNGVDELLVTGLNGQAGFDLGAGTYTVTVLPEYLPPETAVSPTSRTVIISNNTFANTAFTVTPAQSLAVGCEVDGVGFPCTVEVYDEDGNLVAIVDLTNTNPETVITNLPPGSYEVVIVPNEPGWPERSDVVTLDGGTHAEVGYPFNPSNLQTIAGWAYWDRCYPLGQRGNTNTCTETNIPSNNDIPVTLYNAAGTVISVTVTAVSTGWNTGYYVFPNLPVGNYRVEISFPGGFVPQTVTSAWRNLTGFGSPEYLNFGYTRTENRSLTGYAFYDVNNNSSYDVGIDDPYAGADITVSTLAGAPISTHTTASDGSFTVLSITSGEYRVELNTPDLQLTRLAIVPASGGVPWVQFPLLPNDTRPRAIVFLDSNQDGQLNPAEQRLGGVNVALSSQPCGGIAAPIETKATNSDGLALFTNPLTLQMANGPQAAAAAPGNPPGCVKIVTASLPSDVAPANTSGAAMPKNSGAPVLLPVYPQGTLLVQVFWDVDGDGAHDNNEPMLSSGTATVGGQTKSYSENGATFVLATGSYSLNVVAPAGYTISTAQPISVVVGSGTTTRKVAARVAGGINGAVIGPDGAMAGTTVRLTNVTTNQTYDTLAATGCAGWCSDAFYQFGNLPSGQYRLSIPTLPPGHILASEPVVNYTTAGQSIQQNLTLNPLGHLSGVVYLDENVNGQRDSGEAAATGYVVSLLNDGGLPGQTAVPDANGFYLFTELTAGVRYLATVDLYVSQAASMSDSLTEAPGGFLPGTQPVQANIGIYQGGSDHNYNTVYGRVSSGGAGVAGVRIGYFHWVTGQGCQQSSPTWQNLETTSDINGDYKLLTHMLPGNETTYCITARDLSGYVQNNTPATGSNFSYQTTGGAIVWNPGYWQRDISLLPAGAQANRLNSGAVIRWSAFRDDNLNGVWDDDEPALSGVSVGGNTSGILIGLEDGAHSLAVVAPTGYALLHGGAVSVWLNGADVTLPPLPFRFAGALRGQAFADEDGDGWLRRGESGVSGVTITLTGAASASAVTDGLGRFSLPNLPNGNYTVSVTPPAGYAAVSPQIITLNNGGAFSLALRPLAQLSGAVYDDWDGDGRRGADEPLIAMPITVTVAGVGAQRTALGAFRFWDVAAGNVTITPWWQAVNPAAANPATNGAVGFPAVPAGTVRGTAWLDGSSDGLRQPWESPLAGVAVTVAGQTAVTDAEGRFSVYGVAPGTYGVTAVLPAGLTADMGEVVVSEGRGAVVGVAVQVQSGFRVYLPLVVKRP
ncbi:MAG: PKD domain-containing protein [Chloroflexi bacterium]|nr:PKD domain-containing protein [Chloroflexota bacterium]MBP7043858.1 PKD domain-containing protein [Chloroflexota bacterium]